MVKMLECIDNIYIYVTYMCIYKYGILSPKLTKRLKGGNTSEKENSSSKPSVSGAFAVRFREGIYTPQPALILSGASQLGGVLGT